MKDRLTLLYGKTTGDFKVKSLLVYHSDHLASVFKKHNLIKNKLPVMWRANSKAWVTRQMFVKWVHEISAPSVKKY